MKKLFIFIISILFVVNVSALTIENDSYLKYVDIRSNTDYSSNITGNANYDSGTVYFTCDYIANSYGCGVQFRTKEELDLIKGRSYTFSLDIGVTNARIVKSTANKGEYFGLRSVSSTPNYLSAYDYWFNTAISDLPYKVDNVHIEYIDDSSQIITFSFTMLENVSDASIFFFPFGLNKTGIYASTIFELNYLAIDSTNDDVINSLEEQSQEIIRNQNENNEKVLNAIDRVNDNFNSCRDSYNLFDEETLLNYSNYTETLNNNYKGYKQQLKPNTIYTIKVFNNGWVGTGGWIYRVYNSSNLLIGVLQNANLNDDIVISFTTDETGIIYFGVLYGNQDRLTNWFNSVNIMLVEGTSISNYEPYGEEICTNKLDDLENSITDSDTSGATGTGQGFFDNFKDEDNGGISGIVKAPLTLVTNLLGSNSTNSCKDLPLSIMGANVAIPCGKVLWSKVPASTLTIYHTIICGFGAYVILSKLYKDIEDLKDPNTSEVKTTDL